MALTAAEIASCFEIANVIWQVGIGTTATVHDGYGIQLTLTDIDTLQTDLLGRLQNLAAIAETNVRALTVSWATVRLSTAKIESGSAGDTGGLNFSFEEKRAQIKQLFNVYVPVLHMADAQRRKSMTPVGEQVSNIISVSRG